MTDKDWKFKIALDTKCRDEVVRFAKSSPKTNVYGELFKLWKN